MPGSDRCPLLHHYLRRAAGYWPNASAIVEEERVVTFRELWERAGALASFLRGRGLAPGDRVAILLPKTVEAITAMFASLMAGAIYVPIQPDWPLDRTRSTLADCGPRFLVAESMHSLVGTVQAQATSAPIIADLATDERFQWDAALAGMGQRFAEPAVEPGDPAFILFTSGSTGRPKGVTISHGAVGAFVEWAVEEFEVGPADRIACPSPLSFDLSTFDVFGMALCGAACHVVPESVVWLPRFLAQFVLNHRITVWYSVPSILSRLLGEKRFTEGRASELRVLLFAGEVLSSQNLLRLQAAMPGADCYNLYGPTETNVVTYYRAPRNFDPGRPIPIGRACPYAEVRLDRSSAAVRGGEETGELLIAGDSVMSGYWDRPEETERAFVNVCDEGGRRYYKSGDHVVRHANGEYTYIGRLDRQVKRRGFRIELGEIEVALHCHPDIVESAVIASRGEAGETAITAFLQLRPHMVISELEIRAHCARHLPSYMLPDEIAFVDAMPKGDRGKTDYAALAAQSSGRTPSGR